MSLLAIFALTFGLADLPGRPRMKPPLVNGVSVVALGARHSGSPSLLIGTAATVSRL